MLSIVIKNHEFGSRDVRKYEINSSLSLSFDPNCYTERGGSTFVVALNVFVFVLCTGVGIMLRIECPFSAQRLTLKG